MKMFLSKLFFCGSELTFFVTLRLKPRGLHGDTVPNEVKDASLSLAKTK
jgi:hypothetical protein